MQAFDRWFRSTSGYVSYRATKHNKPEHGLLKLTGFKTNGLIAGWLTVTKVLHISKRFNEING